MDFLEPTETYNAGLFARQAEELLGNKRVVIASEAKQSACESSKTDCRGPKNGPRNDNPSASRFVIVGGTGLYLRALVDGLAPLPPRDEDYRRALEERAEREGRAALHAELLRADPGAARNIPPGNIARVIRALEVHHLTGRPISWWQKHKTTPSLRAFLWLGLRWPKEAYEEMLAARCRRLLREGLVEETETLLKEGVPPGAPAFRSLGYPLALERLEGRLSAEELETRFIRQTRLYAKRQMTWFRANARIRWVEAGTDTDPVALAEKFLSLRENS
jgi:tRNA dimethylallyltransferase